MCACGKARRCAATSRCSRRTACCSSDPMTARWRAANSVRAAWPSRWRSSAAIEAALAHAADGPLAGFKALVTAGPTHEPLDPVRFLANHSQRQAGLCHRRGAGRAGADTIAGLRAGRDCAACGVKLAQGHDRARNAGGLRSGSARRRCGDARRPSPTGGPTSPPTARSRRPTTASMPVIAADGESRHPGHARAGARRARGW